MKSLLILKRIKVEGANAIGGIVYGLPALTHFLGFVHSLSRELNKDLQVSLKGTGIICHNFQVHAHKAGGWGESVFSLTRNPLSKEGESTPFNEEGKIHMEVSLLIECDFTLSDLSIEAALIEEKKSKFLDKIHQIISRKRLAGGIITNISSIDFEQIEYNEEDNSKLCRKVVRSLMPGYFLMSRSDELAAHINNNPSQNPFDLFLDFYALKSKSQENSNKDNRYEWEYLSKPALGWIVPIQVGYKAISPLYKEGEVACARDVSVPFRFVEPVYSLGEWKSLHRIEELESVFWRYHQDDDMYLCINEIKK